MCFLPPQCLFCRHYYEDAGVDGPDCAAFAEIPEPIFRGEFDHVAAFPGDGGIRFAVRADMRDELVELNELRNEMDLAPYAINEG